MLKIKFIILWLKIIDNIVINPYVTFDPSDSNHLENSSSRKNMQIRAINERIFNKYKNPNVAKTNKKILSKKLPTQT